MPQLRILQCHTSGDFKHTENWLTKLLKIDPESIIRKYGELGVQALADATPKRTGKTAASWKYDYSVVRDGKGEIGQITLTFSNTNFTEGKQRIPLVILIECGHGTRNHGYVPPHPFVNEATRPIFESLAEDLWKEVTSI